jgi:hypothetical protein
MRDARELTSVGLNAGSYFSGTESIEKCDVLAENRLEITFADTFCVYFA